MEIENIDNTFKIWGITANEQYRDGRLFWELMIHNPFELQDHKFRVGINEKLLKDAIKRGVEKFIIKDKMIWCPTEKMLKKKAKNKEYEDKPSIFEGGSPMRIYYFTI